MFTQVLLNLCYKINKFPRWWNSSNCRPVDHIKSISSIGTSVSMFVVVGKACSDDLSTSLWGLYGTEAFLLARASGSVEQGRHTLFPVNIASGEVASYNHVQH